MKIGARGSDRIVMHRDWAPGISHVSCGDIGHLITNLCVYWQWSEKHMMNLSVSVVAQLISLKFSKMFYEFPAKNKPPIFFDTDTRNWRKNTFGFDIWAQFQNARNRHNKRSYPNPKDRIFDLRSDLNSFYDMKNMHKNTQNLKKVIFIIKTTPFSPCEQRISAHYLHWFSLLIRRLLVFRSILNTYSFLIYNLILWSKAILLQYFTAFSDHILYTYIWVVLLK